MAEERDIPDRAAPPWRRMIPPDLTLVPLVFAAALGVLIGAVEYSYARRLIYVLEVERALRFAALICFSIPFLLLALSRAVSGRARAVVRFLALAFLLGAICGATVMWLFAMAMSGMRFG